MSGASRRKGARGERELVAYLPKGARGERELVAYLRGLGFDPRRGLQYRGGGEAADVIGIPGLHIEVKRCERLRLWPAIEQARQDAAEGAAPAVVHRANHRPWVAVLLLDDLLALVEVLERQTGDARTATPQPIGDPMNIETINPAGRKKPGRLANGQFAPGASGNPSGVNGYGDAQSVAELAREHTEMAIKTLVEIATNGKAERSRVAAATALLDRGWGRPQQAVELSGDATPAFDINVRLVDPKPIGAAEAAG